MIRRSLFFACILACLLAASATPALAAYGPLWSQPVAVDGSLAGAAGAATVVWTESSGGSTSIKAQCWSRTGVPLAATPYTLVSGITAMEGAPLVAADGTQKITVVWKDGGTVFATRVLLGGSAYYGPVAICTDAAVTSLRGAAATATPLKVAADSDGAAYVLLGISPSASAGDSLLTRISPTGILAHASPGLFVANGTIADLAVDGAGHAFVLLGAPGRTSVAVQRYAPDLSPDWQATSPYNPLFGSAPAGTQPLGLVGTKHIVAAWREGAKVGVQRFSSTGTRLWLRPPAVAQTGSVRVTDDGWGGCYLVGTSTDGLAVHHVLYSGLEMGAPHGSRLPLGLAQPRVDGATANRAGDLDVAYGDDAGATAGLARMTFLGGWAGAGLSPAPERLAAVAPDGCSGAYALATGVGAALWHVGEAGPAVTVRPRAARVTYPKGLAVCGYVTSGGEPVAGATVRLRRTGGAAGAAGAPARTAATITDARGYYQTSIAPSASGVLTAISAGAASEGVAIGVSPKVTLNLGHTRIAGRLTEIFAGSVLPNHRGARVRAQRLRQGTWVTIKSGRLDSRSRYRIAWRLPRRTATYKVRVILPAHGDHLKGVSLVAKLRVVVR